MRCPQLELEEGIMIFKLKNPQYSNLHYTLGHGCTGKKGAELLFYNFHSVLAVLSVLKICSHLNCSSYLIFVIFFTQAKFLENKIFTVKRQFFALNL